MNRFLAAAAILLAGSSAALAAEKLPAVSPSATPAQIQAIAEKSCTDALDHDRFDWSTMEECVDDTVAKLKKAQHAAVPGVQTARAN